jgi:hypothetical protein
MLSRVSRSPRKLVLVPSLAAAVEQHVRAVCPKVLKDPYI